MSLHQNDILDKDDMDSIDSYFECVTACSIEDKGIECISECVEVHLKSENS
ncbi:hypothetical protein [Prochlorococcus sp. MIT 1223]|uniref:hypothetical protein n=1 Tax=Prochlorococcus sp. MIT 1223 TaxID=3096217 RepID=UPI002A7585AA|nr:hypothetical protein [Prochlorococcus sp. MIT 1223]